MNNKETETTYIDLEKAYQENDNVVFSLAFLLLTQFGGDTLNKLDDADADRLLPSNLFAPDYKLRVLNVAKLMANAHSKVLIGFIQRVMEHEIDATGETLPFETPFGDESGTCPLCGAAVNFTGDTDCDSEGGTSEWECPECGAYGKECFSSVFNCHIDVCDEAGNPVPGRDPYARHEGQSA